MTCMTFMKLCGNLENIINEKLPKYVQYSLY